MKKLRRVIAGIDEKGVSRFTADEEIEAVTPPTLGTDIIQIFGSDQQLTVPYDGKPAEGLRFFPKDASGFRFIIFTYPAKASPHQLTDDPAAHAETERLTPGIGEAVSGSGGMHATATVDLEYVISGELTLILDSGERKVLRAGDCLVQCGTQHAWLNEGDEPATMLLVFIGVNQDVSRFPAV
ncbi:cupin domain-containing protein [Aquisediminimonas profunda]|uniref:cupin domain-containing protein n=1 Tax=Aquisediminimonas profunda TaxID=1550733 RepID=UPI001C635AC4|nr:cupin domain-containing protein [Aquisediminimonas profunda]